MGSGYATLPAWSPGRESGRMGHAGADGGRGAQCGRRHRSDGARPPDRGCSPRTRRSSSTTTSPATECSPSPAHPGRCRRRRSPTRRCSTASAIAPRSAQERTDADLQVTWSTQVAVHGADDHTLRQWKRSEIVRIALRDLLGLADMPAVGRELAGLAGVCLQAAVDIVEPPPGSPWWRWASSADASSTTRATSTCSSSTTATRSPPHARGAATACGDEPTGRPRHRVPHRPRPAAGRRGGPAHAARSRATCRGTRPGHARGSSRR